MNIFSNHLVRRATLCRRLFLTMALLLTVATLLPAQRWTGRPDDSVFIEKALRDCRSDRPSNLPLYFARKFIGRPYVAHTLEVGDDRRVVVNTRQLDCTTLVENVAALVICARKGSTRFSDFVAALASLRYRNGRPQGYTSRLHYFTDWIVDNSRRRLVVERQQPVSVFSAVQRVRVNYMSTHPKAYKALAATPSMVSDIAASERRLSGLTFRYIPKGAIANTRALRAAVKDGDIIAITCNKPGLDIAHLGFAVWRADGLHLLNASMLHHKVVDEPMTLRKYLSQHPSHTGIRIISIR